MEDPVIKVDPIIFEILSHRLHQITMEMGSTLERVGGTANTTQMHDYMASLYRANGDVLAAGESMGWHVACAGFAVKRIIEQFEKEGIYPDDIFLINDPYLAAIHQSDVYIISPIHHDGRLVGWSATFVHVMDIGALSPGGNSPGATEICHEGLRIPGIKLVERGRLRKDVFNTIINMTRQPVMVGLDLKCEIAANNVAKSRMQALYDQYGSELVDAVSLDMIRYSESILRKRLVEIPDGTWKDTVLIGDQETWKMVLTLRKEHDCLHFDFTGTDKQARTGINLPYHATFGSCFEVVLSCLGYDIPKNHGTFLPIKVIAPEGTVVNVQYPGPVSMNTTSGGSMAKYLAASTLIQMLATSENWLQEVMAHNLGGRFPRHAGVNQYGRYYVSTLLEVNGTGAVSYQDGVNTGGRLSCHNVEWAELNFPLLYLFRRHITDGGGVGKYRGGVGAEAALTVHKAPEGKIKGVALGVAGLKNSGQGILGGYPAASSHLVLFENTKVGEFIANNRPPENLEELGGHAKSLSYCDFDFSNGDVLYIRPGSGGGCGDPLERAPQMVVDDIRNGLVSKEVAHRIYGVVLDEQASTVNLDATKSLRDVLRTGRLKVAAVENSEASREEDHGESNYPPREILEVHSNGAIKKVRCARCRCELCELGTDWKKVCRVALLPPTSAGPLLNELTGHFLLQQRYCPSCGTLLQTDLVEDAGKGVIKRTELHDAQAE